MNRKLSSSAPSNLSTLDVKLVGAEQAGTALPYAVAKADVPAIELVLNEQPQLVNFGDYDKRTPLHVAASEGQLAVVKLLLYKYSAQFRTDRWGGTALDDALRHRHAEIAQLLRSAGGKLGMSPVAAKVLKAEGSAEDKKLALRDLRVECAILRQLRHPHICMLLGACLEAGHETMLSELMRCSMAEVLKTYQEGDRMPKSKAIKYSRQFAMGMNYLHLCSPPIIHRDLKPANLLLDFSDTLKVADFGLAKLRPLPKSGASNGGASEPFVMTGETGSYRFMAPEVFRHEEYSEKVDVYSFAMVTYNMLHGAAPASSSFLHIVTQHSTPHRPCDGPPSYASLARSR